jgi:hypothetical protein
MGSWASVMGYRIVDASDRCSHQAGTPDPWLFGFFLFQVGDSSLDGFKGFAHGVGIGPQHLPFIGSAQRVGGAVGRRICKSTATRAETTSAGPAEAASESHRPGIPIAIPTAESGPVDGAA